MKMLPILCLIGLVSVLSAPGVLSIQRTKVENGQIIYVDKNGLPLPEGKSEINSWHAGDQPGRYLHWTAEAWTGGDAPFVSIKRTIDDQIKRGQKPLELLQTNRAIALEKPMDATAQFRWAYTAFMAREKWQPGQNMNHILDGVIDALERPRSPKSYEYARMRALFTLWDEQKHQFHFAYLPKVVMRLVKRNPKDYQLKYIFAYDFALYKVTISTALEWANEYRKVFPNKTAGFFLLGRVYEGRFGILASESNGKKAIEYFQKYIAAIPLNSVYQAGAEWHIKGIRSNIALFRSKGMLKP